MAIRAFNYRFTEPSKILQQIESEEKHQQWFDKEAKRREEKFKKRSEISKAYRAKKKGETK